MAEKVYSVQRSPTWILPKPDRPYTDREKWMFAHVPFAKKIYRTRLWLRSESNIAVIENGSDKTQEFRDIALRGARRRRCADEELRSRLTPEHPFGCKRLVFATDYLQTLTRPHVEVVSSPATGAARSVAGHRRRHRTRRRRRVVRDRVRRGRLPGPDRRRRGGRRHAARDVARRRVRVSGHGRPGIPELLHALRPEHQRRLQQRHLHARGAGPLHRARAEIHAPQTQGLRRRAADTTMADFIARIDGWMQGTVWLTRCSNYFRAANGRVVTQWPRSARAFWGMTRRFRPADYTFEPPARLPAVEVGSHAAAAWSRLDGGEADCMETDIAARLASRAASSGGGPHRPVAERAWLRAGLFEPAPRGDVARGVNTGGRGDRAASMWGRCRCAIYRGAARRRPR